MISQSVSVSAADTGGKKFYQKIINNSKAFENCDVFGTHFTELRELGWIIRNLKTAAKKSG